MLTVDKCFQAYRDDKFTFTRRPTYNVAGPWNDPSPIDGRTLYIGQRTHSKMARCYEKGAKEARESFGSSWPIAGEQWIQEGKPLGDKVRLEIEFKAVEIESLPFDMLRQTDQYFAGAYPYCAELLEGVPVQKITRETKHVQARSVAQAVRRVRQCSGKDIAGLLQMYGGDAQQVVDLIRRPYASELLIESGAIGKNPVELLQQFSNFPMEAQT